MLLLKITMKEMHKIKNATESISNSRKIFEAQTRKLKLASQRTKKQKE